MRLSLIAVVSVLCAVSIVAALSMLLSELRGHMVLSHGPAHNEASSPSVSQTVHPGGSDRSSPSDDARWSTRLGGLTVGTWVRLVAAGAAGGVVWWVTWWPVAAAACAGMVLIWPLLMAGRRREREEIAVLEAVLVWTQSLRDTVAGGASLEQAIGVSVEGAPPALRPGLEQVRSRLLVRQPLDVALTPLREVPGADFVTAALMLAARRRGDRLPDVLSGVVATCAQEVAQRRQILASRAGIHRSVQIIIVVTLGILAWMATIGAAYMAPYDSAEGQGMLAVVIAVIAAGFFWLARLDTTVSGARFFTPTLSAGDHRLIASLAQSPATVAAGGDTRHTSGPGGPLPAGQERSGSGSRAPSAGASLMTRAEFTSNGRGQDRQRPWE